MLTLSYSAALILGAVTLAAGVLVTWIYFRLHIGTDFVALEAHRNDLMTLRRRYRRRLRAIRDTLQRHKRAEEDLKTQLRVAQDHQHTLSRLLAAAQAEAVRLRGRVADQDTASAQHSTELAEAAARADALARQLQQAQERIAGFERDHGLLRIERDELAASTQRLRALTAPEPATDAGARSETLEPVAGAGASRAELADRNARIHQLQCQLRESTTRMTELQSSLNTWKYRIAPLALHMKMQRDKARRGAQPAAAARSAAVRPDDLQRIRGISRGLEKKLRAEGINHYPQLAAMAPAELANLAVRMGVAASRPQRERWAAQARELAAGEAAAPAVEQRPELV